ncbi:hypothetical protein CC1G_14262 [Coprinopsis cinerea okayama7|uniref:F-box domain-containing protein n=1 Tax=Coprinopsis cinerea (strain Okayama-7 / 130 / ATCC MYA-4618 / FGSC 9003) TaxID=240176 RepID=D6RLF3_COPC7|nr:hypothetical protein CC1G_14262 [Coprinopsis cinerea okayama7\|eukprot:XP_002911731.1 hypothetical protein CC1G_14262 [Coprinopsis cinerea okayama7\
MIGLVLFCSCHGDRRVVALSLQMNQFPKMHRCLEISEIQAKICADLGNEGKKDALARLARIGRVFHESAIRQLWKEIPGLHVITNLLPGCFLERDEELILAHNPPISEHLPRLKKYTDLVKVVDYPTRYYLNKGPKPFHWTALHLLSAGNIIPLPLFRNAREITLPFLLDSRRTTIFYPAFLLSPTVESITILTDEVIDTDIWWGDVLESQPEDAHCKSLINHLAPLASNISRFAIRGTETVWERHTPMVCLSGILPLFSNTLRSLDITHLSMDAEGIASLSRLGGLEDLKLLIQAGTQWPNSRTINFEALTSLDVVIKDAVVDPCQTFFHSMRAPRLQYLSLAFALDGEEVDLGAVFLNLSCAVDSSSLTSITVKVAEINVNYLQDDDMDATAFAVASSTLKPLSIFKNLTTFELDPCRLLPSFTDSDLLELTSSWPNLERLQMQEETTRFKLSETAVTLRGVQEALGHCPKLSFLSIPCDASEIPNNSTLKPHPSLAHWNFNHSPLGCGRHLVKWVLANYPGVKEICNFEQARKELARMCLPSGGRSWEKLEQAADDFLVALAQWNGVLPALAEFRSSTSNTCDSSMGSLI